MLSHTSGMPNEAEDFGWDKPEYDEGALERYVRSLSQETLIAVPGEKYAYSNIAYEVLGDVIAKVSGQPFETYVADHILRPLAMERSTFLVQEVAPELGTGPHLSIPYPVVSAVYPYNRAHAPSSTLHSNVLEMAHWAIANLNRAGPILQPASYDLLWQPYAEVGPEDPGASVGLSWFLSSYKGQRTIDHGGADIGFHTNFFLLPDRGEAAIVLANTVPAPIGQITNVLLDNLLGYEPASPKPPLLMRLSQVLRERGLTAALQTYQQMKEAEMDAYDVDPDHFYDTGDLLRELNRLPEAIDIFKLGLAVHPESDRLYYGLAFVYTRSGDKTQATENVRRCLELNPEHPEAIKLLNELDLAKM
jgi:CubicO group peptidase (beta-lactamase class C family)